MAHIPGKSSQKNLFVLSFTLLVMMLGYAMAMPLIPFYIQKFGVGGTELGWLMSTYSIMQLICAPLWGAISDRIGRKPVLCMGVLGYAVSLLLFGLSTRFWMLFIARSLTGILSSATQPTAMAYIGDTALENERSKSMGQLGAVTGIGVIIGPLVGGLLSKRFLALPFFFGSGLAFLALILVIFLLPETKSVLHIDGTPGLPEGKIQGGRSFSNDLKVGNSRLREVYKQTLFSPAGILLLLAFIISFAMTNVQGMIGLYTIEKFAFTSQQIGMLWVVMGGMLIIVQGGLIGPLNRHFSERVLIRCGLLGGALGFLLIYLADSYLTVLLTMGVFMLAVGIIGPTLNSSLIGFAGKQRGTVMGLNSAAVNFGKVIGPLWAGYLYDINIEYPLLSGAAVLMLGLLVSLSGIRKRL
jgi:DHA1 family multidrug resistance protein-like MFS transporter